MARSGGLDRAPKARLVLLAEAAVTEGGLVGDLREVLDRAQTDYDFYLAMLADPEAALAPFVLTEAERAALTSRDQDALWRVVAGSPTGPGGLSGLAIDEGPPSEGPVEGPPSEGPIEGPPVEGPPVEGPPVEGPPVEGPPVEGPPVEGPPVEGPPVEGPPVEGPPVEGPPIGIGPPGVITVEGPPLEGPPLEGPPLEGPPTGIGTTVGRVGVGVTPGVGDPPSPGVIGVFHFSAGIDISSDPEATDLQGVLANPGVAAAVQSIRAATSSSERLRAVNALVKEIG
jgi:hypothetical protein